MFSYLMDLKFQRTGKQAVGFYLAYILLIGIAGALLGGLYSLIIGTPGYDVYGRIGHFVAVVAVIGLSASIVYKKNILTFKGVFLVLLSGILALFLGSLVGVIPTAYLSTIKDNT